MFLLAKLVGIAGAVLSSGTASAFLIPYFQDKEEDILAQALYTKDLSKSKFDFQKLDQEAKANIELLQSKISKFSLAKTITNIWKHVAYHNIEKIFEKLSQAESQLTNLYKEIVSQIEKLTKKYEEISESSQEKLEAEKEKKFQSTLKDAYTKLSSSLDTWESSMKAIKCAIEQKCTKTWVDGISQIINSIFPVLPINASSSDSGGATESSPASSSSNQNGSEKARAELAEVNKELSALIDEMKKKNDDYKVKQTLARVKEKLILAKLLFLESWMRILNSQKNNLETEIKAKGEETKMLIKDIDKSQKNLISNHQNYTKLKQQEVDLHGWKSTFEEVLLKNNSDLEREAKLSNNI